VILIADRALGDTVTKSVQDPARWLADLMKQQHNPLWPFGGGNEMATAMAKLGDSAPWTQVLSAFTKWQVSAVQLAAAPWVAAWPGLAAPSEPVKDRRFSGEAWSKDPRFDAMARTYLAQTEVLRKALEAAPVDDRTKAQWSFAMRQLTDALSPANNLLTNPEAMQLAIETGGASLIEGLRLFSEDLAKGRISMTDESAFEVGVNVCTTPGTVIYQNDIIQLIQYTPTTERVYEIPLVVVPPCINKYYILDLQPANSFIGHSVAAGHTVFLVSWRNATAEQGKLTWDHYITEGVLRAIDTALAITHAEKANTLGFCIGGTLLASALAVRAAQDQHPAASMTLLTTMLDFSDTGEIGLLVNEQAVKQKEADIGSGGVLKGKELAQVFASLRANDLIWPYVVKGYLQGQPPPPFDLLYWNSDDTNLPGPMYCWYVRNTYLENNIKVPGSTVQAGEKVDLRSISVPTFLYASRDDHIVPWKSAYASSQLLTGDTVFVLGASGHIAGVINPPAKNKRNYWVAPEQTALDADPEKWLEASERVPGSWWPRWHDWLAGRSGEQIAAPETPGSEDFREIEPAPGAYVKAKAS
jgi:polyhydroxyalkanoate synthase subunit PhaC